MRRKLAVLLFCLVPVLSVAQVKLRLDFPSAAPKEVWTGPMFPEGLPTGTQKVEVASLDYALGAVKPDDELFVWDRSTGNVARKPIKDIAGSWKLTDADFKYIGPVSVHIEHKGLPVSAALVKVTGGSHGSQALIDATSNGDAQFFGFPPGDLKVEVDYNVGGKPVTPLKQSFDLSLKRDKPNLNFTVSISDDVPTVAPKTESKPAAAPPSASSPPAPTKPPAPSGSSLLGNIFVFVVCLAIAIGVVFLGLRWLNTHEDSAQATLKKLGVQVPTPQDPNVAPVSQTPIAPQPQQKIILDDAAPTPIAQTPIYTPTTPTEPKLTRDNGQVIDLVDGTMLVGRDDGIPISLSGENSVSRRHAEVNRAGSQVVVRDLGSTNGTFVNGAKITGDTVLRNGDTVQFGAVRFRFEG